MILKKVKITNYRQLQNVELDMQDSLTVLAGPNNSGKTTLISVLKGMFCDKKLSFNYSDIPIQLSSDWLDKILPIFQAVMIKYDRESGVREIITKISNDDNFIADYIMDSFQAQIQVDYNPDNDDIQYFADYLMDLDNTKHSFYFIYTYEPSTSSFEKNLTEHYDRMSARFRDINNPQGVEKDTKLYFLKEELLRLYCNAAIEKCYFCNSDYGNANPMEVFAFKNLFNFQNIPAIRELDDSESDSSKGISKRVISLLKDNDTWVEATKKLPDLLMSDIENSGAKNEIKNSSIIARYLNMPHISTQHGVKGESHPSVIFMASDNNSTPNVRMYPFFELWSNLEFSLPQFETLFYSYNRMIEKVEAELGMKISELTAETHNKSEKNKAILIRYSNEVLEKYQGNILFDALCKDDFISYLAKQNVGNAKKIFKITKMEGILTAYKLFYVGCSRARKNLIVVVDAYKVNGFKEAFMNKMKEIGFSVFCK